MIPATRHPGRLWVVAGALLTAASSLCAAASRVGPASPHTEALGGRADRYLQERADRAAEDGKSPRAEATVRPRGPGSVLVVR